MASMGHPLGKPHLSPALQQAGFQAMRMNIGKPLAGEPRKEPLVSLKNPLPRVRETLVDPNSRIHRLAEATGKERYLSLLVAFSDTLVKIYRTILSFANKQLQEENAPTAKPFPKGGLLA